MRGRVHICGRAGSGQGYSSPHSSGPFSNDPWTDGFERVVGDADVGDNDFAA